MVAQKCGEVLRMLQDHLDELAPVPLQLEVLRNKIVNSRKPHQLVIYTNDILDDVRLILNNLRAILSGQKFYHLPHSLSRFYGNPLLFGDAVAKKFPEASGDIERAGNCLALGEPTACVMHLNRAMEIAVRRLAKKLGVTINAKDNMGAVLGNMTEPIKQMPDKTETQKRKKELWAECRTNLYHVKMAWRDPAHHGKQDYKEEQALDIIQRVSNFMQQLATLL
jgi:hypothetical protein